MRGLVAHWMLVTLTWIIELKLLIRSNKPLIEFELMIEWFIDMNAGLNEMPINYTDLQAVMSFLVLI